MPRDSDVSIIVGAGSGMGRAVGDSPPMVVDSCWPIAPSKRSRRSRRKLADKADVACALLDVTDATAVTALAATAGGGFRSLVITAGLSPTMGTATQILTVNLISMARMLESFTPLAGDGSVAVCFSSVAGHQPVDRTLGAVLDQPLAPDFLEQLAALDRDATTEPVVAYPVSKAGVIRLAARTAQAWGPKGARIVSVSPGIMDTPMGAQEMASQPIMAQMVAGSPLGRLGRPEEIAEVVYFLCSPLASYMTACDVLVDGGIRAKVYGNEVGP